MKRPSVTVRCRGATSYWPLELWDLLQPMSGFDPAKVNAEFFPDGKWKVNFLCNLRYGDPANYFRNPRLDLTSCRVL